MSTSARRLEGRRRSFGSRLQRLVHRLESPPGAALDEPHDEWGQKSRKALFLNEADAIRSRSLDAKPMLAVEETRDTEMTQPAQLLRWRGGKHCGTHTHAATSWRLQLDVETRADHGGTADVRDEGVPGRVGGKIGQDLPYPLRGRLDSDLRMQLRRHPIPR